MKNTKLYLLLSSFSSKDFDDFELYLFSPYHVRNKPLSAVFSIIKNRKDLLAQQNIPKLLNVISRKTKFSISTIKKLISQLSNTVFDYYKIKSVLSDEFYLRISLNQYLLKNGSMHSLEKLQTAIEAEYHRKDKHHHDDLYNMFLHKTNVFNASVVNLKYQSKVKAKNRLQTINEAGQYITLYSLVQMTLLYANYVLNSVDSGNDIIDGFCLPLDQYFELSVSGMKNSADKSISRIFDLYYKSFKCYRNLSNVNLYKEYKNTFLLQLDHLDDESVYIHYNLLLGYCSASQRIFCSDKFFDKEELELLDFSMKNKLYKNEITSILSPITYRNYVLLCLENMDMIKLKNLIDNYTSELNLSERVEMAHYAYTHYYYGVHDIKKALKYLNTVDIKKFNYKYDLLDLEIKIHFERNDLISLEKLFHNYREMVKRDNLLTKYDKSRFMIFFKYLSEFIRIANLPESKDVRLDLEYLMNQIGKEKSFVMKKWLSNKITNQLSKSISKNNSVN